MFYIFSVVKKFLIVYFFVLLSGLANALPKDSLFEHNGNIYRADTCINPYGVPINKSAFFNLLDSTSSYIETDSSVISESMAITVVRIYNTLGLLEDIDEKQQKSINRFLLLSVTNHNHDKVISVLKMTSYSTKYYSSTYNLFLGDYFHCNSCYMITR